MNCRHHPTCPGCPLLSRPYAEQLQIKHERLRAAFALYPHLPTPPPVRPALRAEGYRHRLKLPVHVGDQHVAIGLYDPRSGRVLDTPDCPVLEPGLRTALGQVRDWMRGRRGVHSLDLRRSAATGELMAVLACQGGDLHGGARGVRMLMDKVPGLVSVAVSEADPKGKRVMGRAPKVVAGTAALEEAIGDTRYRLYPGAFFQVDPVNATQLHALVREGVGSARRVLDLYAGVGAYALMLAPGRERVVMVEEVPQAAAAASAKAPKNVEVITSPVENNRLNEHFDVAVINPARRGSDPHTLARLATMAERVVYVSCGPETLARDLDCLAFHGLRVRTVTPLDLFPQTPEVETVVVLERGRPLTRFPVPGGEATGPWGQAWSGALGRPEEVLVLAIGDTGAHGELQGTRYRRTAVIAGHSLLHLDLRGSLQSALAMLARRGHPIAGQDPRTQGFFAEKAGLNRPFIHVSRAGRARAPLHGDLRAALNVLGEKG